MAYILQEEFAAALMPMHIGTLTASGMSLQA